MSGTSHDGLDLAYCIFSQQAEQWSFRILKAETIPYTKAWKERLLMLHKIPEDEIRMADMELGAYIGQQLKRFITEHELEVDFIGSHGHTVFHKPERKLTLQIGNGKQIAEHCGITVVNDFRSSDVNMGGQGAPLVPIGDRLLFEEYEYCLNLGGIANISFEEQGMRVAFDICPANMVLNMLAEQLGTPYDDKGALAEEGKLIPDLLAQLELLEYYQISGPRSLGREWVEKEIFPLLKTYAQFSVPDLLATFTEHIAMRIGAVLKVAGKQMLVTGGGAYNNYLISRLQCNCPVDIILPEEIIIDYKEAMIFALLGLLRIKEINNVLGSVTGAPNDHCAGEIIHP